MSGEIQCAGCKKSIKKINSYTAGNEDYCLECYEEVCEEWDKSNGDI